MENNKKKRLTKKEMELMNFILNDVKQSGLLPAQYTNIVISMLKKNCFRIESIEDFRKNIQNVYNRNASDWGIDFAIRDVAMLIRILGIEQAKRVINQ